jgi:hypothetical protein
MSGIVVHARARPVDQQIEHAIGLLAMVASRSGERSGGLRPAIGSAMFRRWGSAFVNC